MELDKTFCRVGVIAMFTSLFFVANYRKLNWEIRLLSEYCIRRKVNTIISEPRAGKIGSSSTKCPTNYSGEDTNY